MPRTGENKKSTGPKEEKGLDLHHAEINKRREFLRSEDKQRKRKTLAANKSKAWEGGFKKFCRVKKRNETKAVSKHKKG